MSRRPRASSLVVALLVGCVGAASPSHADPPEDDASGDEFDFGGEEEDAAPVEQPEEPRRYALTGFLRSDWALWNERSPDQPLAKARQSLDLSLTYKRSWFRLHVAGHAEFDLAYLIDRDSHDAATRDAYEWQLNTREALVAFSFGEFEITLGRQIIAWGEGDALSPIDVVNPRDLREPGLADLDDIRLPVLATTIGWFRGAHRVELMVIHESDFGLRPAPRSPYSPLAARLGDIPGALRFDHRQPRFAFDQQAVLGRWVYKGEGIDLGFYEATILDRQGVVVLDAARIVQQVATGEAALDIDHRRYGIVGVSGAVPVSSFLIKWEVAAELSRPLNTGSFPENGGLPSVGVERTYIVNTMAAVTWTGVQDLVIALELNKPWIVDRPDALLFEVDAPFFALRGSYRMLRERLTLLVAASMIGWTADGGWLVRGQASYEIVDSLEVMLGYITYQPGGALGLLSGLDRHDRVFARIRWDFQLL